ncbi:hypothetical protein B0H13DRAFT_2430062 [Mycena leptocephala]|nr:hypothetical protein B0H13DRAFT_2430062 [Mycena leptocephala]
MISTARSTPKTRFEQRLQFTHPSIALSSPACPKHSFIRGHKSSRPKVADVSIWLRWAVDPASALRVLLPSLLTLPTHFHPYLPPSLHGVVNAFTPFFLLSHRTPTPDRLSAAVVRPELGGPTQLYLKGPGDLALLVYSVVLFSLLRLVLSHMLFPMLARKWRIRKARKVARFGVLFGGGVWATPRTPNFWLDWRCAAFFSSMRTHVPASTGGWLARGMRMRGACGPPVAHLPNPPRSWTCGVADSRRTVSVPMRMLLTFMDALRSWGVPGPELNAGSYNKSASPGAIFGAPMWMQGIEMRALYGPGHVYAQRRVRWYRYWYRYLFLRSRR